MTARRRWIIRVAPVYAVILLAVALGLGRLYNASRSRLDEAMGDRLLGVASSLAVMVEADRIFALTVGDTSAAAYVDSLAHRIEQVQRRALLADVTLSSPDGIVLLSTSAALKAGQANDYWHLDPAAIDLALDGFAQTTHLYRLQRTYQKSAHAPVTLSDAQPGDGFVVAIVTVSGNPDFFDSLTALRRGAYLTAGAVLLVLVLMGVVLYNIHEAIERYRASILRQENLATLGRMTTGIAHEIRNPLGIIRGAGQHLQRVLDQAGIQDEVAEFIPDEVDRLDHILTGYLALGTDREAVNEVGDLGLIVRRSLRLLADELTAAGIKTELADGLPEAPVLADPRRLQQVLLNLVLNATDAMDDGGVLTLNLIVRDTKAFLTIADTGQGLGDVGAERLFEPFHTSKEKGSGLGLAISRRIVEEAGGHLTLRNREGGTGAIAALELPLAPGD